MNLHYVILMMDKTGDIKSIKISVDALIGRLSDKIRQAEQIYPEYVVAGVIYTGLS